MFWEQQSLNVLVIVFGLDERSKKHFCKRYDHDTETEHLRILEIFKTMFLQRFYNLNLLSGLLRIYINLVIKPC